MAPAAEQGPLSPPTSPHHRPASAAGARPTSGRRRSIDVSKAKGERKDEWKPWKDRIRGHKDVVLHSEVIVDHSEDATGFTLLLTATADGTARIFELGVSAAPVVRRKLALAPPAAMALRCGAATGAAAAAVANEAGGPGAPADIVAAAHVSAQSAPHAYHGVPFATAFAYVDFGDRTPSCPSGSRGASPEVEPPETPRSPPQSPTKWRAPKPTTGCHGLIVGGYECGRLCGWNAVDGRRSLDILGHGLSITALRVCSAETAGVTDEMPEDEPGSIPAAGNAVPSSPREKKKKEAKNKQAQRSTTVAILLSTSLDCTLRAWRLLEHSGTGSLEDRLAAVCLYVLEVGARNPVADLALLGNGFAAIGGWDGRLRLLSLKQCSCLSVTDVAAIGGVTVLCPSEDSLQIHIGCDDCQISTWALSAGLECAPKQIRCWKAHDGQVSRLLIWGDFLISASEDRSIRIWHMENDGNLEKAKMKLADELYGHTGAILSACIATEEKLLVTGSRDWSVRTWDLAEAARRIEERDRMAQMDIESRAWLKEMVRLAREKKKTGQRGANTKTKPKGRTGKR